MASYRCETCGDEHEEPRDVGFNLPDEIFAIPVEERATRVVADSEACVLDDSRHFVRCILEIPTPDRGPPGERVGIGAWAEVSRADLNRILDYAGDEHAKERPIYLGHMGNAFGRTIRIGEELVIKPWSGSQRPRLYVTGGDHPVTAWQRDGIPWDAWQRILASALPSFAYQRYHERAPRYSISSVATDGKCPCCSETVVDVAAEVVFDDVRVARYFARVSGRHAPVAMLISVGKWDEGAEASERVAIHLELRAEGTVVGDAGNSFLGARPELGTPLSREDALAHACIDDAFEISDVARERDDNLVAALAEGAPPVSATSPAPAPEGPVAAPKAYDRHRHRAAGVLLTVVGAGVVWTSQSKTELFDRLSIAVLGATIMSLALFLAIVGEPQDDRGAPPRWFKPAIGLVAGVGAVAGVICAMAVRG